MLIGLDFDNTIVSYDQVFYDVAKEWELIPETLATNKLAVRDYLREAGLEDRWTQMQGYVYGNRMDQAKAYSGFTHFVEQVNAAGHSLVIVSHKTQYPFLGPQYDLHAAALAWIKSNIGLDSKQIFFEPTKVQKIERIAKLQCDVFVDDLPEIVTSPLFPKNTMAILFDPDSVHTISDIHVRTSWAHIQQMLEL